jgi:ubiquitin-protein ligase
MNDIVNIIKQIQSDIINPQVALESILLKAKVLAHYLDNNELKKWVKNELDGYPNTNGLPDYRITGAALFGTFFNGVYQYSNHIISITTIPQDLREFVGKVYFPQGLVGLEGMAKNGNLRHPMPGDWVDLYNILNAESLSHGHYKLIEAHHPVPDTSIIQTLGAIRSRLQDFVLEISSLPWDMAHEPPPSEQISKIFQVTIYHNSGEINMTDIQQEHGDTYHVGQAGAVGRYARSDGNTFIQSEQKQTLSEVAEEIQKLLKQLETTNPSATQAEMIAYVNDETTPSLKRRTSSALKACGEAAIDEFVLENKFLKVVKATLKGWLEADS